MTPRCPRRASTRSGSPGNTPACWARRRIARPWNCQALVSLTLARGEVPVPVALRLYLPKAWCRDRRRCDKAGVPADRRAFRSKGAIALDELDRLSAAGVRFGCALADTGYGHRSEERRV